MMFSFDLLKWSFTCIFFVVGSAAAQTGKMDWLHKVGAKSFPSGKKIFTVNDYGAVSDTVTVNTTAIQKAINDCAAHGGGIVTFKPGTYISGSIFIKSNVHLRIDKNVLILGSQNFSDYPDIETRIAGVEMRWPAALINMIDVKNAALTGSGTVNARGKFCWDLYWATRRIYDGKGLRWIVDYDVKRIRTVLVQNAEDVSVKGLTLKNAGFWTVQLLYSKQISVDGIAIKNNEDGSGPSTDGVDIDSSTWVLVQNCDIDCNDDNFCLKAGRDWDGLRVNKPTAYVVIRKCMARRGAGLITLGSETSGGIHHIFATDLYAKHTDNGLRVKSAFTRGGIIEDIYFQNVVLDSVKNIFQFNLNWYPAYSYSQLPDEYKYDSIPPHWKAMLQKVSPVEKGIPAAKNFYIDRITATHANVVFDAAGYPQSLLTNFSFSNSTVTAATLGTMEYSKDWKYHNFNVSIGKASLPAVPNGQAEAERLK
jgi:polygalacturonase